MSIRLPATFSGSVVTGSPLIVILSQHGVTSGASGGLDWNATAPTATVGQEVAIQAVIDAALAASVALGNSGIKIIWDVAAILAVQSDVESKMMAGDGLPFAPVVDGIVVHEMPITSIAEDCSRCRGPGRRGS